MYHFIKYRLLLFSLGLLTITTAVFAKSDSLINDYSGHWELNSKKSNMVENMTVPGEVPVTLFFDQKKAFMVIQKLMNGCPAEIDTLRFDGSISKTITPFSGKRAAHIEMNTDKGSFTVLYVFDSVGATKPSIQKIQETYLLSEDKKCIYATRVVRKGTIENTTKLVYDLVLPRAKVKPVLYRMGANGTISAAKSNAPAILKADFSGEWNIDTAKSDFFGLSPTHSVYAQLVIEQNIQNILLTLRFKSDVESVFYKTHARYKTDSLDLNGSMTIRPIYNSYRKRTNIKWSEAGNSFTTKAHIYAEPGNNLIKLLEPYDVTEIYVMSDDKQEITLHRISVTPVLTYTVRAVYKKVSN